MSNENHVMALLREGNPAPSLGDESWTDVNAATYLANLEQRSSEMTAVQKEESRKETPRGPNTRWLVAAIAVIVLGLFVLYQMTTDEVAAPEGIPLEGAEDHPGAAEAFTAVEAAYDAFNSGDRAWIETRLKGSSQVTPKQRSDIEADWLADQAYDTRFDVERCVARGLTRRPDLVDPGVAVVEGFHFTCETSLTDSLLEIAGVRTYEAFDWVVADGTVVAVKSVDDRRETEAFLSDFESWLAENEPQLRLEDLLEDPESVAIALAAAREFLAQSDTYPIDSDS